jgi:hypothetical protein
MDEQQIDQMMGFARAWLMVEKAAKLGYWCEISSPFSPGDTWSAGFNQHLKAVGQSGYLDYAADGSTMPEAVARAALKLFEATKEDDNG